MKIFLSAFQLNVWYVSPLLVISIGRLHMCVISSFLRFRFHLVFTMINFVYTTNVKDDFLH